MNNRKQEFPEKEELEEVVAEIRSIPFPLIVNFSDVIKRYTEIFFKNPLHYNYLGIIAKHGGKLPPSKLAQLLFRSKHGITKLTDALESKGYVKRLPDPKDRRALNVMITRAGLDRLRRSTDKGQKFVSDIVSTLNDQEMTELVSYLRRLRKAVIKKLQTP